MLGLKNDKQKEQKLIASCIKGISSAQKKLYDKHHQKMFGVCLRYAADFHSAEDILQEGFVKVFKHIKSYKGTGAFEGWLRRIFVNTAIEHYRKSKPLYPINNAVLYQPNGDVGIVEKMSAQEIMKIVNQLSTGYKTIFNLYVVEGFTHADIAEKLGISVGTSKSQLARARYLLQKKINKLRETEKAYVSG